MLVNYRYTENQATREGVEVGFSLGEENKAEAKYLDA